MRKITIIGNRYKTPSTGRVTGDPRDRTPEQEAAIRKHREALLKKAGNRWEKLS